MSLIDPKYCRVYWGSHGCDLDAGHAGPHLCHCAVRNWQNFLPEGYHDEDGVWSVGAPPYYGPKTQFYGEDAPPDHYAEWQRNMELAATVLDEYLRTPLTP